MRTLLTLVAAVIAAAGARAQCSGSCGGSGSGASGANPTASVGTSAILGSAITFMRSDAAPPLNLAIAPTWTGLHTFSGGVVNATAGAASTSASIFTGTPYSGGTGTTNFPLVLIQPTGTTASSTWGASGTLIGVNAAAGNLVDLQTNGASQFRVSAAGVATFSGSIAGNPAAALSSVTLSAASLLTWSGGLSLSSPASQQLQLGGADNGSPSAKTLQAQSVVAGTSNTAGPNLTIQGSRGTGNAAGGAICLATSPSGSSGTAQNAARAAVCVNADGAWQPQIAFSAAGTALPTCNAGERGARAYVTDATAPTFLATYASGGSVTAPVFCNGSAWVTD